MKDKAIGYVVPHTHWDREWRYPLWENRLYLRDFMDELLDTLQNNPEYKSFLLDGQVVAILDYLEICIDKKEELKELIHTNRILIGPWYTLPDLYPVSGESIVRNLLRGKQEAEKLGGYMKIGYESFGWGQPSQLPQIYKGFDIDTVIVSKNVDKTRAPKCEFKWKGADGTSVLATRLGDDARANFFMNAYLKIMTGKEYKSTEYEYKYTEDGQIYHQADKEGYIEDYFKLENTERIHDEYIKEAIEKAWNGMIDTLLPNDRIMMDGTDSTTSQPLLMQLLDKMNEQSEDIYFKSSSLEEYIQVMKEKLDIEDLLEINGEMRDGPTTSLSGNALMTRPYIKTLNRQVQNRLFSMAEPISVINMMLKGKYEDQFLHKALDYLLLSHPHDSINGVTQDKTVDDVMYRLSQVSEIADTVYNRGLQEIIRKIDLSSYEKDELLFIVFNPTAKARTEIIELYLDTPQEREIWDFEVEDSKGNKRSLQFRERKEHVSPVVHLQARPFPFYSDRHAIFFETGLVPAGGYEVYRLVNIDTFNRKTKFWAKTRKTTGNEIAQGCDYMENEYIAVHINSDGSITMIDKETDEVYGPLNYYESTGDVGDYWMYYPPYNNRTYTSKGIPSSIYLKENGDLIATIAVDSVMRIPKYSNRPDCYIRGNSDRSEELEDLPITTLYTLKKTTKQVEVEVIIHNQCRDHRMSVLMETGVETTSVNAQGHFTVDNRKTLPRIDSEGKYYNELTTQPMQNFVSVGDSQRGVAVITDCLGEYEFRTDKKKTLAFTLFRAVKNIICTEFRSEGYFPNQDGGQLQRELRYHYAILPQSKDYVKEGLSYRAEAFNIPLKPIQINVPKKNQGVLPLSYSFFEVLGNVDISCIKKGEEGNSIIMRIYNPTNLVQDATIILQAEFAKVELVDLKEDCIEVLNASGKEVRLSIPSNKIYTLRFILG